MNSTKRAILIVVDGLGVGAMEDCKLVRPSSIGSNSFLHVVDKANISFINLEAMGMCSYLNKKDPGGILGFRGVGKSKLMHFGADSYEGHNEIMGNRPKQPMSQTMREVGADILAALILKGYNAWRIPNSTAIMVEPGIVVADNMETDPAQVINVTGALDEISFSGILDIGTIVRQLVSTNRVIAFGGTGINKQDLLHALFSRDGVCGINTPELNIYNDTYQVRHLGLGIDNRKQVQTILSSAGIPVYLFGKMADVINGQANIRKSMVNTDLILQEIASTINREPPGFIAVTLQQTDLYGHMGDPEGYANVLYQLDTFLPILLEMISNGDLLIITGDHGNDPTACDSAHSREYVPFLVYMKDGRQRSLACLADRSTLADAAATICTFYQTEMPENGKSTLEELKSSEVLTWL